MSKNDTSKAFRFSPEELAELEAAKKKHGSYKAAIMAGIRKDADAETMTVEEVVAWLQRNVRLKVR